MTGLVQRTVVDGWRRGWVGGWWSLPVCGAQQTADADGALLPLALLCGLIALGYDSPRVQWDTATCAIPRPYHRIIFKAVNKVIL